MWAAAIRAGAALGLRRPGGKPYRGHVDRKPRPIGGPGKPRRPRTSKTTEAAIRHYESTRKPKRKTGGAVGAGARVARTVLRDGPSRRGTRRDPRRKTGGRPTIAGALGFGRGPRRKPTTSSATSRGGKRGPSTRGEAPGILGRSTRGTAARRRSSAAGSATKARARGTRRTTRRTRNSHNRRGR